MDVARTNVECPCLKALAFYECADGVLLFIVPFMITGQLCPFLPRSECQISLDVVTIGCKS